MTDYNGLNSGLRTHFIQVTFQDGEYTGHITYKMGGNCVGLDLLDFDPDCIDQDDISHYTENDCKLRFDEEVGIFLIELSNAAGDTKELELDSQELSRIVVGIKIVRWNWD